MKTENRSKEGTALYANDYSEIGVRDLVARLTQASNLMNSVGKKVKGDTTVNGILSILNDRLATVDNGVYAQMRITSNVIQVKSQGCLINLGQIHPSLAELVALFKERSDFRQSIDETNKTKKNSDFQDTAFSKYERKIEFGLPFNELDIVKPCFDINGLFQKRVYENNLDNLLLHEIRIFKTFWAYARQLRNKNERIKLLSALQLLIERMKYPEPPIDYLLTDICNLPEMCSFSDRNALMLSNLLLRLYNKELHFNTMRTPAEVLKVQNGLNRSIIKHVGERLSIYHQRLHKKIETIQKYKYDMLDHRRWVDTILPVRFLLSLERELYLFLSLVSGEIARKIIRGALRVYGNPDSELYRMPKGLDYYTEFFRMLKVLISAMARVGNNSDVSFMEEHILKIEKLGKIDDAYKGSGSIRRYIELAEESIMKIQSVGI